ncbi:MAG: hypothetical protein CFE36_14355 [Sphingomonadaceae bacterium PASS1]|nr:MAG: hypothetical protein CFE36_14355 [Sphingomonadaceae bacterium PASS1]
MCPLLRGLRGFFWIFGKERILLDLRRLIEFGCMDFYLCFVLLFYRPTTLIVFKGQCLLTPLIARAVGVRITLVFGSLPILSDRWVLCSKPKIWHYIENAQQKIAHIVVCESTFIAKLLKHDNVSVVHTFMDPRQIVKHPRCFSRDIGERPKVLFVGDDERKGAECFAKSCDGIDFSRVEVVAISDHLAVKDCKKISMAPRMKREKFLEYLNEIDSIVTPTAGDGGPRIIFEALWRGKSVISSHYCAATDLSDNPLVTLTSLNPIDIATAINSFQREPQIIVAGLQKLRNSVTRQQRLLLRSL